MIPRRLPMALVALLLVCCRKAPQPKWPILPYDGRFAYDDRLPELFARVHDALGPASRRVSSALGCDVNPDRYRYRFVSFSPQGTLHGNRAWTSFDGDLPPEISLQLEPLLYGLADPTAVLAHELTHAAMHDQLRGRAIPAWLDEGLAVYASGQTEEKVDAAVVWSKTPRAGDIVRPLANDTPRWNDYAVDALAIAFLQSRTPDAVHELVRRLADGEEARTAIEHVSGLPWSDFENAAQSYARAALDRAAGQDRDRFRAAVALFDAGRDREAVAGLAPLAGNDRSVFKTAALFYAANASSRLGDAAAACRDFDALLGNPRREPSIFADVLASAARARRKCGRRADARELEDELALYLPPR